MGCEELIIDQKIIDPEMEAEEQRQAKLIFDLNHTFSGSEEYRNHEETVQRPDRGRQ